MVQITGVTWYELHEKIGSLPGNFRNRHARILFSVARLECRGLSCSRVEVQTGVDAKRCPVIEKAAARTFRLSQDHRNAFATKTFLVLKSCRN